MQSSNSGTTYHHPLMSISGFTSKANYLEKIAFAGYIMYSEENGQIIGGRIVNPWGFSTISRGSFTDQGLKFRTDTMLREDGLVSTDYDLQKVDDVRYSGTVKSPFINGLVDCQLALMEEKAYIATISRKKL